MRRDDVHCHEVVEALTDYLEGALPVEQRSALEQHLLLCHPCAEFVRQMRTSIGLTGRLSDEDVPSEVMDQVLRMFRER